MFDDREFTQMSRGTAMVFVSGICAKISGRVIAAPALIRLAVAPRIPTPRLHILSLLHFHGGQCIGSRLKTGEVGDDHALARHIRLAAVIMKHNMSTRLVIPPKLSPGRLGLAAGARFHRCPSELDDRDKRQ
jgi:hypothetical protein